MIAGEVTGDRILHKKGDGFLFPLRMSFLMEVYSLSTPQDTTLLPYNSQLEVDMAVLGNYQGRDSLYLLV